MNHLKCFLLLLMINTVNIVSAQEDDFKIMKSRFNEVIFETTLNLTDTDTSFKIVITFPTNYFGKKSNIIITPHFSGIASGKLQKRMFVGSNFKTAPDVAKVVEYDKGGKFSFKIIPKIEEPYTGDSYLNLDVTIKSEYQTPYFIENHQSLKFALKDGKITNKIDNKTEEKNTPPQNNVPENIIPTNEDDDSQTTTTESPTDTIKNDPKELDNYLAKIKEAEKKKDSKELIILYENIATIYFDQKNYPEAKSAYLEAIDNSVLNNQYSETGRLYAEVAKINYLEKDKTEAITNYKQALKYYSIKNEKQYIEPIYNNLAILYYTTSNYVQSINSYQEAINNAAAENQTKYLAKIANCYNQLEQLTNSNEYYQKIIVVEIQNNNTQELAASYNNLAANNISLGKYEDASQYIEKAIEINVTEKNLATLYNNYANINLENNNFEKSLENYAKSLEISTLNEDKKTEAIIYHNLGILFFNRNDMIKAKESFIYSNELAYENGYTDLITKNMFMLSQMLTNGTCNTEDIKIFNEYLLKANPKMASFNKPISLYVEKYTEMMNNQTLIYELSIKEQSIKEQEQAIINQKLTNNLLQRENEIQYQKAREQRKLIYGLIFFMLIFLLISAYAILQLRLKKKANKLLSITNTKIKEQAETLKQANEEIKVINEDLNNQKEELATALENLQDTQLQLIKAEKMAALSQLISGIAHEMNTPLGAIKTSVFEINNAINEVNILMPMLLSNISKPEFNLFQEMVKLCALNNTNYSSREMRQLKKDLAKKLKPLDIENDDIITDYLADLKIFDNYDKYMTLIKNKENVLIFKTAYNIVIQTTNANNIGKAVESSSKIIFTLKAYSLSTNETEKIETDINASIDNVIKMYKNMTANKIDVYTYFEEIPTRMTYPEQMTHLWSNLIYNSIQAIDTQGKIEIYTKNINDKILVTITDTGKGIQEEIKHKIFEPFFTTKAMGEGIGLGLDICKRILDNHNGKIYFESQENLYTKFYIEL